MRSAVRADVTGAAITEFFKEVDSVSAGELTQADLEKAQQQLRTEFINEVATLSRLVGSAASYGQDGLGTAQRTQLLTDIQSLTLEDLKAAARKFYARKDIRIVLVGDRKLVEGQIAKLGLPTAEVFQP
jgi:predicted Zn-dependent peptidase